MPRRSGCCLQDLDPHHVGAFFDTGHTAINGGPSAWNWTWFGRGCPWWRSRTCLGEAPKGWNLPGRRRPAQGIVSLGRRRPGLKEGKFNGTISLHGEYEAKDLDESEEAGEAGTGGAEEETGVRVPEP